MPTTSKVEGSAYLCNGDLVYLAIVRYYAAEAISKQHRAYLADLPNGSFVSVSFFGQPVPLLVVGGGVVKIEKISKGGDQITGTRAISAALGILETRKPVAWPQAEY